MHFRITAVLGAVLLLSVTGHAQQPGAGAGPATQNADSRIRALQREADQLAARARTLLNELRALEIARQIKIQERAKADAELAAVNKAVAEGERRVTLLESQRLAETPGVQDRLVTIYKRGRAGYVRMMLSAQDLRTFGRLTRGVAAIARMDRVKLEDHRKLVRAEQTALAELTKRRTDAVTAQRQAVSAEQEVRRAVAAHNARLDDLDRQRDLAARYLGELESAQTALANRVGSLGPAPAAAPAPPQKGDLDWPIAGRVVSPFGRSWGRFGTAITRNGIDIGTSEGTEVKAAHTGTVAYAAPFTGYGTLVILDHGDNAFTLYGHLNEASVAPGAAVSRGQMVGRAGRTPTGVPALYFELRIDGRPVDPVQWLRSNR